MAASGFVGEQQRVTRGLHARADDEVLRAHAEDFVKESVKLGRVVLRTEDVMRSFMVWGF